MLEVYQVGRGDQLGLIQRICIKKTCYLKTLIKKTIFIVVSASVV